MHIHLQASFFNCFFYILYLSEKTNCTVSQYKGKHFSKLSAKVYVDDKIAGKVNDLDGLAKLCKVHILAQKSFVLAADPKTANTLDLKDKTNPNHYVGQAISLHIHDEDDKLACNDICLGSTKNFLFVFFLCDNFMIFY